MHSFKKKLGLMPEGWIMRPACLYTGLKYLGRYFIRKAFQSNMYLHLHLMALFSPQDFTTTR